VGAGRGSESQNAGLGYPATRYRKFIHDIETVRSIVLAYANDEIELKIKTNTDTTQARYAPSFVVEGAVGGGLPLPYTATEITEFLGWPKNNAGNNSSSNERVMIALGALELNEQGHMAQEYNEVSGTEYNEVSGTEYNEVSGTEYNEVSGTRQECTCVSPPSIATGCAALSGGTS